MATAAVDVPPSNHVLPGSHPLPTPPWPEPSKPNPKTVNPEAVTSEWVESFNQSITADGASIPNLFAAESNWRDLLCFSNDFHTSQGPDKIIEFVKKSLHTGWLTIDASKEHKKPQIINLAGLEIVQTFLKIETRSGRGEGLLRLVKSGDDGSWKALTLFTTLKELKGYEENTNSRRPSGLEKDPAAGGMNWSDRRRAQLNFEGDREPAVLILGIIAISAGVDCLCSSIRILGAGQGGLTVAARLKQLGVETLVIDRNPRVGDNWRNRYHQLVLHDSVWCVPDLDIYPQSHKPETDTYSRYDHMPYLAFPPSWPVSSHSSPLLKSLSTGNYRSSRPKISLPTGLSTTPMS